MVTISIPPRGAYESDMVVMLPKSIAQIDLVDSKQ